MDARLMLQGLVPLVDFGSKQPLYVAFLAFGMKLFGPHLMVGRILVVLCQVSTAWILYAIGRQLADNRTGLLAAALYSLLPFFIIWATIVKTEPPAIFLAALSAYLFILGMRKTSPFFWPFFCAGSIACLDYYVRQSTLFLPLASLIFIGFYRDVHRTFRYTAFLIYIAGFVFICMMVVLLYSMWMPLGEILFSPINPLELVMSRGLHVLGLVPETYRIADSSGFRIMDQEVATTVLAWQDSLLLSLFIIVSLLLTLLYHWKAIWTLCRTSRICYVLLWFTVVLAMYVFQSIQRGFFSQYFLEILTPALLLISLLPGRQFFKSQQGILLVIGGSTLFFYFVMAMSRILNWMLLPIHINYWLALVVVLLIQKQRSWQTWFLGFALGAVLQVFFLIAPFSLFVKLLSVVAAFYGLVWFTSTERSKTAFQYTTVLAFCLTAAYSGWRLGPTYECIWSPHTLQQMNAQLAKEDPSATVLSGTTIWALESGLQPYLTITHPTELLRKFHSEFSEKFTHQPPDIIILDGYTQRKYSRYWPLIANAIESRYEKVAMFYESKSPVEIYRLIPAL